MPSKHSQEVTVARRTVILLPLVAVAACEDTPGGAPTSTSPRPSASNGHDPATVAALLTAATQIQQVAGRYTAVVRRHPALGRRLAPAVKHRAAHLARLKALGGAAPGTTAVKAVPATPAAALADLRRREQVLAAAHATAAAKLSGEPARVLAMVAASEAQIALGGL